ncbi:unnamed protein product [Thelazia callipaeda]|uniref:G_PROTEIN_RECEP_F1_2 domain-containing protein n=1 Tax=Thelazia callipaeda TaxID=103827 RepID=A0A0N5DBV9_THECL|nr:unnamed protein product [Thelazia callipaeda]
MNSRACEIGSVQFQNATWLFAALADFQQAYGLIHPYIAVLLCFTGTILNVMTIAVLTRPSMLSPVNVLLCSVAICDVLVMTSYSIFVTHFLISAASRCLHTDYNYPWTVFTLIHAHVSVVLHSTSIWLTVLLAQIRVLTIRRGARQPATSVTIRFTVILSVATCLVMTLFNLPNFLTFKATYKNVKIKNIVMLFFKIVRISPKLFLPCLLSESDNFSLPLQTISLSTTLSPPSMASSSSSTSLSIDNSHEDEYFEQNFDYTDENDQYPVYMLVPSQGDCLKLKLAFWSNGILFKVLPCLLLTVSIIVLLKVISDLSRQRRTLAKVNLNQSIKRIILKYVYLPMGDFMDLLSLINSAVNFLIYCIMNKRFRATFLQLFCGFCSIQRVTKEISNLCKFQLMIPTSQHRPSAASVILSLSAAREKSLKNDKKLCENLTCISDNQCQKLPVVVENNG